MPRAVVCSHYLPQPELDSYSRRLFHLVTCLRRQGWEVSCVARSPEGVEFFGPLLREAGIEVAHGFAEHMEHVRRAVLRGPCDVAILGFWVFAEPLLPLIRSLSPRTRIIVDSGDVHFLRNARRRLRESAEPSVALGPDFTAEAAREIAVYAAADAVFAVSPKEADLIGDLVGRPRRVHVVPDGEDLGASAVPLPERRGLFFVGNFEHPPNLEAIRFLSAEVLPRIDPELLEVHPLWVAGSHVDAEVQSLLDGQRGVRLVGWVPSVEPYFARARVSLLPVLHGAGTKRKLIQALSVGTPTVSTGIGVEGFDLADGDGVLVADDPDDFAEAVARLLGDDALWTTLATRGRERILRHHSAAAVRERFLAAIDAVRAGDTGVRAVITPVPEADPKIELALASDARRHPRSRPLERPEISVVIPTRDRRDLLDLALGSLAVQEGVEGRLEVVVVDDGSADDTAAVCRKWGERMPLLFVESTPAGISAAKNLGIAAASAPLLLFFDDDDVAAPDLVARHVEAHRRHPLEQTAVLGHTAWSPQLEVNELMHYVTEVGCYLFGYPHLRHGHVYDFRFFWGGRSSCKRSLLVAAGGFRPEFTFGSEDIEAGYRMSCLLAHRRRGPASAPTSAPVQLGVVYESRARQHVVRPMTYDDFCRRCERQGRSQWQFAGFYRDPGVAEWCGTVDAPTRWAAIRDELPRRVARVHELEADVRGRDAGDPARRDELHRLYGWTFDAFKLKGIVEAAGAAEGGARGGSSS